MAFTQFTKDMEIIGKLSDTPNVDNGMTADQLKAKFDEAGEAIKEYINDTLLKECEAPIPTERIADGAVTRDKIADGSISTSKLIVKSVTTTALNDGAVTAAKIASSAVTTAKIADGAVATEKLASGAVAPAANKLSTARKILIKDASGTFGSSSAENSFDGSADVTLRMPSGAKFSTLVAGEFLCGSSFPTKPVAGQIFFKI